MFNSNSATSTDEDACGKKVIEKSDDDDDFKLLTFTIYCHY